MRQIVLLLMAFSISFSSLFAEVTANDILNKKAQRWDITFSDTEKGDLDNTETLLKEVNRVAKEIDKISVLLPRATLLGSCSGGTGCNLDSAQCDAVTEVPFCPDDSVLNTTRDMCQKDPDVFNCPDGYTYDNMVGQCVKPLECPYGGTYVVERQRCESPIIYDCPTGYTLTDGVCVSPPLCDAGAKFNPVNNQCEVSATFKCSGFEDGWIYDDADNLCYKTPDCANGLTYNPTINKCGAKFNPVCPNGYSFHEKRDRCEKNPTCKGGSSYSTATNRCEQASNSACASGDALWDGEKCSKYDFVNPSIEPEIYSNQWWNCDSCGIMPIGHLQNLVRAAGGTGPKESWTESTRWGTTAVTGVKNDSPITVQIGINGIYINVAPGQIGVVQYKKIGNKSTGQYRASGGKPMIYLKATKDKCTDLVLVPATKDYPSHYKCVNSTNTVTCPPGYSIINESGGSSCRKDTIYEASCPSEYIHNGTGKCYINPTCDNGGKFDGNADQCYLEVQKNCQDLVGCPDGYAFNKNTDQCEKSPECPGGTTYNVTTNRCEKFANSACTDVSGTWNGSKCEYSVDVSYAGTKIPDSSSNAYSDCASSAMSISSAHTYCSNLTEGSFTDWRVPSESKGDFYKITAFGGTIPSCSGWTWVQGKNSDAWSGGSFAGSLGGNRKVRCVRGGSGSFVHYSSAVKYSCPNGEMLSGTTCVKTVAKYASPSCSANYTHDGNGKCYANPTCSKGGQFDGNRDVCYYKDISHDTTTNLCLLDPFCNTGTLNLPKDRCEKPYKPQCTDGWTWSDSAQKCERTPKCVTGTTYSATFNTCISDFSKTCSDGYSYNSTRDRCEKNPECSSGSTYNATTNKCVQPNNSACSNGQWTENTCVKESSYAAIASTKWEWLTQNYVKASSSGMFYRPAHWATVLSLEKANVQISWNWNSGVKNGALYHIDRDGIGLIKTSYRITNCFSNGWTAWGECNQVFYDPVYIDEDFIPFDGFNGYWSNYPSRERWQLHDTGLTEYSCPDGDTLSGTSCNFMMDYAPSCPTNYTHDGNGRCQINPTCSSGGQFDGNADKCYLNFSKTCTSNKGTYDATIDKCIISPNCFGGVLDNDRDICQQSNEIVCPAGEKDLITGMCTFHSTCTGTGSLDLALSTCKDDKIPLACDNGTDNTLEVCYAKQNACYIDDSFVNHSTLSYSYALKACLADEEIVCASSLTWSENIMKCEVVPICNYGVYNPENDFCFADDYSCPIDPNLECKGTEQFNHWCSPWECNSNNQCGYAFCSNNQTPKNTSPWMLRSLLGDIAYIANSQCVGANCDIVTNRDISYCGEDSCPKGFGVYEKNNKCYQNVCPDGSFLGQDNNCYIEE